MADETAEHVRRSLAPGQRRAWFLQHRAPADAGLNVGITYRLTGALDAGLLRAAVGEVVARHEILRTVYGAAADGEPFQAALADPEIAWQEADLADLPSPSRARRAEVLLRRVLGEPFDPSAAPPIRFALIRTGPDEFAFVLVAHALCWDDESWEIFSRELTHAYNGILPTGPATQYADLTVGHIDSRPPHPATTLPSAAEVSSAEPSAASASAASSSAAGVSPVPPSAAGVSPVPPSAVGVSPVLPSAVGVSPVLPSAVGVSPVPPSAVGVSPVPPSAVGVSPVLPSAGEVSAAGTSGSGPDAGYLGVADSGSEGSDAAGIDYWRAELSPLPEPLDLPSGSAPAPRSAAARRSVRELPGELLSSVDDFAQQSGTTALPVLLAAFDVLVRRYTGAADFLVSVPVTTRDQHSAADSPTAPIGYFGNTVLLRAEVDDHLSFADLVAVVRGSWERAHRHRAVGIDEVVRVVNPDRTADRDGLDQLVRLGFGVRTAAAGPALDGVVAARLDLGSPVPRVPLRLTVVRDGAGAYLEAEYPSGRFTPELIEQLLTHYLRLLAEATAAPGRLIGELDLLGPAEQARLLELSRGEQTPVVPTTVVALFEERAQLHATALALVAPGDTETVQLTYRELNRRANRLAHWLIGQGVGAEDLVALRLSNSVEFVVAVLAVLKSGAAYLPIDPAYPDERIDYLIADSLPSMILGRVELDAAEEVASGAAEHDPSDADRVRPLRPGNLAYVIYTSGSTGHPKGVPVSHEAIADHLVGFRAQWGMTAEDRLLQSSSVSFDASLLDVFVTLTLGARLIIPRPGGFSDLAYIADLVTRFHVTVLHMVPSLLRTFLSLPQVSAWRSLRFVPVGGEALPGEIADRLTGVLDAELRNHYGPTEAVVSATHMPVEGPQGNRIVPIGRPNRNVDLYLLDERLRLVPPGVVGEIYLGGAQLARGYLDRGAATAERFIADPFRIADLRTAGARLYRTGDLARRNLEGEVEFIGRADEQVKVRGYRIELGEVQAALIGDPEIRDCVVTVIGDAATGPMLAAYLVPESGAPDVIRVRARAATMLPEYMVPTAYAVIDAIPLTEHGKLARRALPEPLCVTARPYREPVTAAEIRLAALFGQLFDRARIGADDSFFELGGHSLLANQLVARIRAEFGFEIDVRAVFDTPAVSGLAAVLEATAVSVAVVATRDEEYR
ncbi:non-ribosomal peptide synthetase [Nocardia sp.]|uniref:non-ribosomal peptide synthetase n=1 Tax=Nocardia sp. TaxID=1821 RepID=UPI002637B9F7|nr:amino acid adenylation domain-containing protein [Nocardia sp.]